MEKTILTREKLHNLTTHYMRTTVAILYWLFRYRRLVYQKIAIYFSPLQLMWFWIEVSKFFWPHFLQKNLAHCIKCIVHTYMLLYLICHFSCTIVTIKKQWELLKYQSVSFFSSSAPSCAMLWHFLNVSFEISKPSLWIYSK